MRLADIKWLNITKKPMTLIYKINRSQRRRSIALKVTAGELYVLAPQHASTAAIAAVVEAKAAWVRKHLERQRVQLNRLAPREWQSGEQIRWLGMPLTIEVLRGTRKQVEQVGDRLRLTLTARSPAATTAYQLVRTWYQAQAQQWLDQFFKQWQVTQLMPIGWSVGDFSSKWGHCTRAGALRFSWKLWLAPAWVVHNVVIHELCHLREFNHSPAFWQLVARYSPNYREAEQWLRQHGMTVLNNKFLDYCEAAELTGK